MGSAVFLLHINTHAASHLLHRSYSDSFLGIVIQPTLLAVPVPSLKNTNLSFGTNIKHKHVDLKGLKEIVSIFL